MAELSDYSGPLKHDAGFEDFSRDALIKLLKAYSKIYLGYMGNWNSVMKQYMSADQLIKYETEVYIRTAKQLEAPQIMTALNIKGNDVITLLKIMQMLPDGARPEAYAPEYEIKNNNHVIYTIKTCPSLNYWEKIGDEKAIHLTCDPGGMEEVTMQIYAELINPDIKIIPVKLPPRKSKEEVACVWEIKVVPKN